MPDELIEGLIIFVMPENIKWQEPHSYLNPYFQGGQKAWEGQVCMEVRVEIWTVGQRRLPLINGWMHLEPAVLRLTGILQDIYRLTRFSPWDHLHTGIEKEFPS